MSNDLDALVALGRDELARYLSSNPSLKHDLSFQRSYIYGFLAYATLQGDKPNEGVASVEGFRRGYDDASHVLGPNV